MEFGPAFKVAFIAITVTAFAAGVAVAGLVWLGVSVL